jgi:hypothetical protein
MLGRLETMKRSDLDPWRVILHHLFFMHSRDIPHILDRAGLAVDWELTEKEAYSEKARLAAYRPRINTAYEALTDENKLRAAYIIVSTFKDIGIEDLNRDLGQIGWKVESGRLIPSTAEVSELFFPTGSQHDAYVEIRRIVQNAQNSISVVDPYVNGTIFSLLTNVKDSVSAIRILTHKFPPDFTLEGIRFKSQYPKMSVDVRSTREFHDRFLVIDYQDCWHIGCSIKDAGVRAFMISKLEDQRNRESLLQQIDDSWANAAPVAI